MRFYQPDVLKAREIQLRRWRSMATKLCINSACRDFLITELDIPPEAVNKLIEAGRLVQAAVRLVESQTEP